MGDASILVGKSDVRRFAARALRQPPLSTGSQLGRQLLRGVLGSLTRN